MGQDHLENSWWNSVNRNRAMGVIMPIILDLLYREYCRARLAEMRKQLLIATERSEALGADCHPADQGDENGTKAHRETGRRAPN